MPSTLVVLMMVTSDNTGGLPIIVRNICIPRGITLSSKKHISKLNFTTSDFTVYPTINPAIKYTKKRIAVLMEHYVMLPPMFMTKKVNLNAKRSHKHNPV